MAYDQGRHYPPPGRPYPPQQRQQTHFVQQAHQPPPGSHYYPQEEPEYVQQAYHQPAYHQTRGQYGAGPVYQSGQNGPYGRQPAFDQTDDRHAHPREDQYSGYATNGASNLTYQQQYDQQHGQRHDQPHRGGHDNRREPRPAPPPQERYAHRPMANSGQQSYEAPYRDWGGAGHHELQQRDPVHAAPMDPPSARGRANGPRAVNTLPASPPDPRGIASPQNHSYRHDRDDFARKQEVREKSAPPARRKPLIEAFSPTVVPQDNAFPTFPIKKDGVTSKARDSAGGNSALSRESSGEHARPSTSGAVSGSRSKALDEPARRLPPANAIPADARPRTANDESTRQRNQLYDDISHDEMSSMPTGPPIFSGPRDRKIRAGPEGQRQPDSQRNDTQPINMPVHGKQSNRPIANGLENVQSVERKRPVVQHVATAPIVPQHHAAYAEPDHMHSRARPQYNQQLVRDQVATDGFQNTHSYDRPRPGLPHISTAPVMPPQLVETHHLSPVAAPHRSITATERSNAIEDRSIRSPHSAQERSQTTPWDNYEENGRDGRRKHESMAEFYADYYSADLSGPRAQTASMIREQQIEHEMPDFDNLKEDSNPHSAHQRGLTIDQHLNEVHINDAVPPVPNHSYGMPNKAPSPAYVKPVYKSGAIAQPEVHEVKSKPAEMTGFVFGIPGEHLPQHEHLRRQRESPVTRSGPPGQDIARHGLPQEQSYNLPYVDAGQGRPDKQIQSRFNGGQADYGPTPGSSNPMRDPRNMTPPLPGHQGSRDPRDTRRTPLPEEQISGMAAPPSMSHYPQGMYQSQPRGATPVRGVMSPPPPPNQNAPVLPNYDSNKRPGPQGGMDPRGFDPRAHNTRVMDQRSPPGAGLRDPRDPRGMAQNGGPAQSMQGAARLPISQQNLQASSRRDVPPHQVRDQRQPPPLQQPEPIASPRSPNDVLPHHPVPVRPGLVDPSPPQAARLPPVRQYNLPNSSSTSVAKPPSINARASTDERRSSLPVTPGELAQLRSQVDAHPSDHKTALYLAKRLVEASVILASENGRLDAKATNKNRERYILDAHKRIKKLVQSGDKDAQFYLADCYGQGLLGLEVDTKEAFALYLAAAKSGHPGAAYRTAVCCEMGPEEGGGTRKDLTKAVQWYRRAAQLQDDAAMYKLGVILLKGLLGQQKNVTEAVIWLKKAAERADDVNPHALHELALLHEPTNTDPTIRGKVVPDEKYSRELFIKAAKLGYKASQFRLGQAYEYGSLGLPIDARNSIAWYSKAAAQGEHGAELSLSGW